MRFFRYSGTKASKYPKIINPYIQNTDLKVYCEPFVGSGGILFNLTKQFEKYVINDKDVNIIKMYRTFNEIEYSDYIHSLDFIRKEFGDIKESKESYYNFRNWFNEELYNTETIEEGLYLHSLANSCINSLLRFGPNGMNQSFGHRFFKLDNCSFVHIKEIIGSCEIHNENFDSVIKEYKKEAFFFLDPPYMERDSSYESFNENKLSLLLELITDEEFVYTDTLNEINQDRFPTQRVIRKMVNTAPSSNKGKNGTTEMIFSSIELEDELNEWM